MRTIFQPTIVIVAPEEYSDLARRISHEISKLDRFNSTYWTISQYKANEITTSNRQFAIFIGGTKENDLTKEYLPIMQSNHPGNSAGIFIGFNASKAIVFGEGNLSQAYEFIKLYNIIKKRNIEIDDKNSNKNDLLSFSVAALVLGLIGISFMSLFKFISKKKKEKKLRKAQTELALAIFLMDEFNDWTKIEKEDIV